MKELKEKLQKLLLDAKAICDTAEKENRDFTAEERQQVMTLLDEAKTLKSQIKQREGDAELRKTIADLGAGLESRDGDRKAPDGGPAAPTGTIGEQFVNAEAFQAWLKQIAPSGRIPDSAKGLMSPPVEFKSLFGRKAPLTGASDTSAGAFVVADDTGIYEPLGRRPLTVRDLIANRQTTSDTVEFVRQTAQVTAAAPVAEATATSGSSGTKPEGSMAFERVSETVKTIAVWIPATKRALSDVAQLRGIIDMELRDDLDEALEDQIVAGSGSGENFTGILATDGVLEQEFETDLLTTARKAVTTLRVTGRARATAWLVHPEDAERIDLLKDLEGRYYYAGPVDGGVQRLWRHPVVESEALDPGVAVLGDWRKAVLWDRERATVQVSDSHSDFFIRNLVAVLAEMRAAFGVIRPSAFIKVHLTAGS